MSEREIKIELPEGLNAWATMRAKELGYDSVDRFMEALIQDDLVSQGNDDGVLRALAKLTPEQEAEIDAMLLEEAQRRTKVGGSST
jgi:hypothetical protein